MGAIVPMWKNILAFSTCGFVVFWNRAEEFRVKQKCNGVHAYASAHKYILRPTEILSLQSIPAVTCSYSYVKCILFSDPIWYWMGLSLAYFCYPLAAWREYLSIHFHSINFCSGHILLNTFILYEYFDPLSVISHRSKWTKWLYGNPVQESRWVSRLRLT